MVDWASASFLSSAPAVSQRIDPKTIITKVTRPPAPRAIRMRLSMMLTTSHRRGGGVVVGVGEAEMLEVRKK